MRQLAVAMLMVVTCGSAFADEPLALKPGHGGDLTNAYCNACHTSDYIVMNSPFLTSDGWKAEVTKMRKAFAAPIDDESAATIIAYLADNYSVQAKR